MTARVTIDDLEFAATWLDYYDSGPEGGESDERAARVAAWLRAEIERRTEDAEVRAVVKQTGTTAERARAKLRELRARQQV